MVSFSPPLPPPPPRPPPRSVLAIKSKGLVIGCVDCGPASNVAQFVEEANRIKAQNNALPAAAYSAYANIGIPTAVPVNGGAAMQQLQMQLQGMQQGVQMQGMQGMQMQGMQMATAMPVAQTAMPVAQTVVVAGMKGGAGSASPTAPAMANMDRGAGAAGVTDIATQLERLVQLRADGVLTQEEFDVAKSRVLTA